MCFIMLLRIKAIKVVRLSAIYNANLHRLTSKMPLLQKVKWNKIILFFSWNFYMIFGSGSSKKKLNVLNLQICNAHFVSCMLLNTLLADADLQEWRQFKVEADRKKTTFVFGIWLTASESIDFVTKYLANNKISGDALVDFSCKVYLSVNIRVKKIVIWHLF